MRKEITAADFAWTGSLFGDTQQEHIVAALLLAALIILPLAALIAWYLHSRPRETCPECGQARLLSKMYHTVTGGRVCEICVRSRLWGDRCKGMRGKV